MGDMRKWIDAVIRLNLVESQQTHNDAYIDILRADADIEFLKLIYATYSDFEEPTADFTKPYNELDTNVLADLRHALHSIDSMYYNRKFKVNTSNSLWTIYNVISRYAYPYQR